VGGPSSFSLGLWYCFTALGDDLVCLSPLAVRCNRGLLREGGRGLLAATWSVTWQWDNEDYRMERRELTALLYSSALSLVVSCVFVFVFVRTAPFACSHSVMLSPKRRMVFLQLDRSGLTSCRSGLLQPLRAPPVSRLATPAAISIGSEMEDRQPLKEAAKQKDGPEAWRKRTANNWLPPHLGNVKLSPQHTLFTLA
jgi:hypothetical protein